MQLGVGLWQAASWFPDDVDIIIIIIIIMMMIIIVMIALQCSWGVAGPAGFQLISTVDNSTPASTATPSH